MAGGPQALPMSIRKVGDLVYEISPGRALYPGEYAVSPSNSTEKRQ
jgi:hypothetical protein